MRAGLQFVKRALFLCFFVRFILVGEIKAEIKVLFHCRGSPIHIGGKVLKQRSGLHESVLESIGHTWEARHVLWYPITATGVDWITTCQCG